MKTSLSSIRWIVFSVFLTSCSWGQYVADENPEPRKTVQQPKTAPGAGRDIGSGAANLGTGAARGAGDLGKGAAKGIGNLATLHPIDAGVSVGKGAGAAGKDVTVGAVKGTAKIGRGFGKVVKKIL
jgi:hypothetical protein